MSPTSLMLLLALAAPADAASSAAVTIRARINDAVTTSHGFLIDADGRVATCLGAVRGADEVAIKLDSGEIFDRVTVVGFDERRDLVILQLPGFDLPAVPLADSGSVAAGQTVQSVDGQAGVVSAVRVLERGVRVIETDLVEAAPGQPLLDERGQAIGVISAEPGLSLPINDLRGLLTQDLEFGLAQLATALGAGTDLFAAGEVAVPATAPAPSSGVEGFWGPEGGAAVAQLRMKGARIVGEALDDTGETTGTVYKLKPQSDGTFKGAALVPSRYGGSTKVPLRVLRIDPDRIELVYDADPRTWVRQRPPGS